MYILYVVFNFQNFWDIFCGTVICNASRYASHNTISVLLQCFSFGFDCLFTFYPASISEMKEFRPTFNQILSRFLSYVFLTFILRSISYESPFPLIPTSSCIPKIDSSRMYLCRKRKRGKNKQTKTCLLFTNLSLPVFQVVCWRIGERKLPENLFVLITWSRYSLRRNHSR